MAASIERNTDAAADRILRGTPMALHARILGALERQPERAASNFAATAFQSTTFHQAAR